MAGADKMIDLSPPGGIGLVDRTARLLIRFDEIETSTRPRDVTGACGDFDVAVAPVAVVMPAVGQAALGRGRVFNGGTTGLAARDIDPGATLMTRDMSIQAVVSWDAASQDLAGQPGTIISRGLGNTVAERVCYGLRLDVVDAGEFRANMRWYWQDVAGAEQLQDGAEVIIPPGQFTMLTATRRWISPTSVELRYYVGDALLAVVASADGSIGGGTTGALQIGYRTVAGVNGAFLAGTIDELMVVDRELVAEEIESTWLRITRYQPLGVQLFREQFDQDFPISDVASSDAQLDIRRTGQALGFAAAQIEDLRANFLPQRSYGETLAQWEQAFAVTPKPVPSAGSVQERRGRVLARMRQRQGIAIPGIKEALRDLVDCDVDDLEFIAYSNHVTDGFDAAIDTQLWDFTPTGCATFNAGKARFAPGAGEFVHDNHVRDWRTIARSISQPTIPGSFGGEHVLAKLSIVTPQNNFCAGIWLGDKGLNNYIILELRQDGTFKVAVETFVAGVSQGVTILANLGASNPAAIWLHLFEHGPGQWTAQWSLSGPPDFEFLSSSAIVHPTLVHWAGLHIRTLDAAAAGVADFDDFELLMPNGSRPFNAYVFRDPGLGGTPDLEAAHEVLQAIKHGFTHATIITSRAVLSGDPEGRCDRGPMGSL